MADLKTASVLAFERKLDPSDALMYSTEWDRRQDINSWQSLAIREKSVRGTISNRLNTKDQDPTKLDAKIENPNLQTVDVVALPSTADTLVTQFTLRVLSGVGNPSACNSADYRDKLQSVVDGYITESGLGALASRYAANLVNGRFLWRNRLGAENVRVSIDRLRDGRPEKSWEFDALSMSLLNLDAAPYQANDFASLAAAVEEGLAGQSHVLLRVTAYVRVGAGQEVFPSQELILDQGSSKKSKTLYDVSGVAAMHSQKIGNAIRTIDSWYEGAEDKGPIAVEPYGSVTTQGKAYRQPKEKQDFYSLLDGWIIKDKAPSVEQQHFVMATLIRGGVFGKAD